MKRSDPLNGLRGLAALHVMTGHYTTRIWHVSLFIEAEMPLFFLLSGYCLTLREHFKKNLLSLTKFPLGSVPSPPPFYSLNPYNFFIFP